MTDAPFPDNAWLTYREATQRWGKQTNPGQVEYVRADIHAAALAEVERLNRERLLAEAQVERLLPLMTSMDRDFENFVEAVQALGVMPEGYCFCSKDRIGDDSKNHEPECADIRALMKGC